MLHQFRTITPSELSNELPGVSFKWWICGGWAIELFVGRKIREHPDVDLAIFRKDQLKLKEQLPGWEFKIAYQGILHDWGEYEIKLPQHAIWARKKGHDKWLTEFLLNESNETEWIFRKDANIRYPLERIGLRIDNIPVLKPMIPLLFKSAHCSEKDNLDFAGALEKMKIAEKQLLKKWIQAFQPDCIWLEDL